MSDRHYIVKISWVEMRCVLCSGYFATVCTAHTKQPQSRYETRYYAEIGPAKSIKTQREKKGQKVSIYYVIDDDLRVLTDDLDAQIVDEERRMTAAANRMEALEAESAATIDAPKPRRKRKPKAQALPSGWRACPRPDCVLPDPHEGACKIENYTR